MKLSFIVPIYNVEPYLQKCVDSLLHQGYVDYEIILVDDGSTDGSGLLADQLASSPIIRVIHQENRGLSCARNTGILAAQGDCICFVDSDDYVEPSVFGGLLNQMEREQLDVLRFDYQNVRIREDGIYEVFEPNKTPRQVDQRTDVTDGETYLNERMGYACYAVQFMIRRSLLVEDESPILFKEGIYYEDTEWTPRMLLAAKRVNSSTTIAYNYLMRMGSITKAVSAEKQKKQVDDKLIVIESLSHIMNEVGDRRWLQGMISVMALGVLTEVAQYRLNARTYVSRLHELGVFPLCAHCVIRSAKRKMQIANFWPKFYIYLMKMRS